MIPIHQFRLSKKQIRVLKEEEDSAKRKNEELFSENIFKERWR